MSAKKVFSAINRQHSLEKMAKEQFDILIIGGGITGAGIALDASVRGLKTGLLEKQDFASGTSSRSTKLIHGGLRYLKQGEFQLVREMGKERAILYRNAPHIVYPEKMLLPLVKKGTYGRLATSFGLWLYDILAGVQEAERRVMLSQKQTTELEPLLRKDILKGGGLYYEYRTDDARLTIEVLKTAAEYGAQCANYSLVKNFIYKDNKIVGVEVWDQINDRVHQIYAKKVVNAAGPWSDQLREKDGSLKGKRLHLTKGVHIVVPYTRLPLNQSVYFDVPDGRMIFAIPREDSTYIGTTDTTYTHNIDHPMVTKDDVDYLLQAVNHMFPTVRLGEKDITSSWAGLRPLIHEEGKSPSELSRKDDIFISPSNLITIAGGKLTGYRKMAERVVDLVMKQFVQEKNIDFTPCQTDGIVLSGGDFQERFPESTHFHDAKRKFIQTLYDEYGCADLVPEDIASLVNKYGTNTERIMSTYHELRSSRDDTELPGFSARHQLLIAELRYGIENEMVTSLQDFLIRRTGKLYFERDRLVEGYDSLMKQLANILEWPAKKLKDQQQMFEREIEYTTIFPA